MSLAMRASVKSGWQRPLEAADGSPLGAQRGEAVVGGTCRAGSTLEPQARRSDMENEIRNNQNTLEMEYNEM